jgi:DNA-binding NtrC family response regulator
MAGLVLVVDDRARARRALALELEDAGFEVIEAGDGSEAWQLFCRRAPDLVITDLVMPRGDGLELLQRIRSRSDVPVILFTARGTVERASAAFKAGADEFVASSDIDTDELVRLVADAIERRAPAAELPELRQRLPGKSEAVTRVRAQLAGLAPLRTPVLVCGERGTGRDTAARAIHELGSTAGSHLEVIACASFRANQTLPGHGALYLDAVEDLTPDAQSYWRQRLANAEAAGFRDGPRILASSGDNLLARVRDGSFDADLGSRLLRFSVRLPPLRERVEDVTEIADRLVGAIGAKLGRRIALSPSAREFVATREWSGNVAQLERLLERAVTFTRGRQIRRQTIEELQADERRTVADIRRIHTAEERERLIRALEETGGNISQAAERLGRSRGAVYRLIQKHGIALRRG